MSISAAHDMSTHRHADHGFETIRDLIDGMAGARPEATFLISPETKRVLTFREFQRQSRILASKLRHLGLTHGDKIAFLMDNGLFTVQLFLGRCTAGSCRCRSTFGLAYPNCRTC